jgi:small-conductance mechanosensitive channel
LERVCTILAFSLLIVSALALWRGKTDVAFVLGTLGAVAWFVGFRLQLSRTNAKEEATETAGDDTEDSDEN